MMFARYCCKTHGIIWDYYSGKDCLCTDLHKLDIISNDWGAVHYSFFIVKRCSSTFVV